MVGSGLRTNSGAALISPDGGANLRTVFRCEITSIVHNGSLVADPSNRLRQKCVVGRSALISPMRAHVQVCPAEDQHAALTDLLGDQERIAIGRPGQDDRPPA